MTTQAKPTFRHLQIFVDGVFAVAGRIEDGDARNIVDCGSDLGYSDSFDEIYDSIQDAIESGDDAIKYDGHLYTWEIGDPI